MYLHAHLSSVQLSLLESKRDLPPLLCPAEIFFLTYCLKFYLPPGPWAWPSTDLNPKSRELSWNTKMNPLHHEPWDGCTHSWRSPGTVGSFTASRVYEGQISLLRHTYVGTPKRVYHSLRSLFIGRTDAEAETPILWPLNEKSWLTGKDTDGKIEGRRRRTWQRMSWLDASSTQWT